MRINFAHPILRAGLGARPPARHKLLASLAAAVLAGCTLGPDYKRPDVPLPPVWRVDLPDAAAVANTEWWRAFGDPDLDALIEAALAANKDLQQAAFRIEQFDARRQIVGAPKYPQLGYAAGASRERRSQERPDGLDPGVGPIVNNFEVGGNFTWELDLWGRLRRADEAARAELLSTQEGRRALMLTVVASVATSYVTLLELDGRLASAKQVLSNRKDAVELLDKKYKGGSGTRIAVEEARAVVEGVAAEIAPIERDIALVENTVSVLLGRNPGPIQRRKLDALALPQMPEGVPADVLSRRPDVMAAEQDLVAANARIGVAKTGYFPTLSLNAVLGVGADDLQWLWATTARTGSLGVGLTGPLFSGGRIEGNIREAEAAQREKLVRFQQAVQNALLEIESALVSRSKSDQREAALGRQVGVLQEAAKLAQLRYEGGQSNLIEPLDADLKVYAAQSEQSRSRRDTVLALIAVYKAMGGGWMLERDMRQAPVSPAADVQARASVDIEADK